jgi:hypothetical protein
MNALRAEPTHNTAETSVVEAEGTEFAYRRFGRPAELPLIMLQHFRGNLDNWDPALRSPRSARSSWSTTPASAPQPASRAARSRRWPDR